MSVPSGSGGPLGDPGSRRFLADVLTFGWVLPASIAAGAGLGWVLDKVFGLFPTLTFAVAFVGFAAGLRQILKEAEALSRDGKRPGDGPS